MRRVRRWSFSLVLLTVLATPFCTRAQVIRLGTEFQVNTYTTSSQFRASVAAGVDGRFVVTWTSQDGSSYGIFARRFSSTGTPLANDFQVNTYTSGGQYFPVVAADSAGDFVVTWPSVDQDGSSYGVFARRFSSAGVPLGSEFQVNSFTNNNQFLPSVAADSDGDFVIAWTSNGQDYSSYGVFARRFSSTGTPLAAEFQVSTFTALGQSSPSVAADSGGNFVVAWQSNGQDGSGYGVFARRFNADGTPQASEFQINAFTASSQFRPWVAADTDGNFVVAWTSNGQDGSSSGVFARRFSSTGTPLANEFQVNAYTPSAQSLPLVAADADGDFVVTWQSSSDQDGSSYGVFGRSFSSTGTPLTPEFQVNTYTTGGQRYPGVAVDSDGDFVVTWHSDGQDGSASGVFAQRFAAPKILDIDADGSVAPLTDGLLILRYMFGFTGSTLVTGAVGGGCTRCDANAIETYLATLV